MFIFSISCSAVLRCVESSSRNPSRKQHQAAKPVKKTEAVADEFAFGRKHLGQKDNTEREPQQTENVNEASAFFAQDRASTETLSNFKIQPLTDAEGHQRQAEEFLTTEPNWKECHCSGEACKIDMLKNIEKYAPARVPQSLLIYQRPPNSKDSHWRAKLELARQRILENVGYLRRLETLRPFAARRAKTRCSTCNGTGWENCEYCNGRGIIRTREFQSNMKNRRIVVHLPVLLPHGNLMKCPLCGGFRRERCSRCFGCGDLKDAAKALEELKEFEREHHDDSDEMEGSAESEARDSSAERFRQLERNSALADGKIPEATSTSDLPNLSPDS